MSFQKGDREFEADDVVQRYPVNDRKLVYPIIELAMDSDVSVWVHTGHHLNATTTQMGMLTRDFPERKLIIGHMGRGMFYDAMSMSVRHAKLYVDISLQGSHSFGVACEEVAAHKLLYGSDSLYANPGPMKRSISAAAGFVINGGAIIPREATPYWRGRSRYGMRRRCARGGCPKSTASRSFRSRTTKCTSMAAASAATRCSCAATPAPGRSRKQRSPRQRRRAGCRPRCGSAGATRA
jgi:hypothetical protein